MASPKGQTRKSPSEPRRKGTSLITSPTKQQPEVDWPSRDYPKEASPGLGREDGKRGCMMRAIFVIVLLATVIPSFPAAAFNLGKELGNCFHGGCDVVWGLNRRIDQGIQSKAASLVGPVRDAFIQAMTDLFDKKLNPFLDKVNDDLGARIDQVGNRADKIVDETTTGILKIIDAAAEVAEQTSGDVQKIILLSFRETDLLVDKINGDITALVDDIDCKFNGTFQGLIDELSRLLPAPPHPFDLCYTGLGYILTVPDRIDIINWYRITKCVWKRDLDSSKTVEDITSNYARLSTLARRVRCSTRPARDSDDR
jgi:hypothetical protein